MLGLQNGPLIVCIHFDAFSMLIPMTYLISEFFEIFNEILNLFYLMSCQFEEG